MAENEKTAAFEEDRPFKAKDFLDAFSEQEAEQIAKICNDRIELLRRLAEEDAKQE